MRDRSDDPSHNERTFYHEAHLAKLKKEGHILFNDALNTSNKWLRIIPGLLTPISGKQWRT